MEGTGRWLGRLRQHQPLGRSRRRSDAVVPDLRRLPRTDPGDPGALSRRPAAEDRGADPHQRAAGVDRRLEVGGHSHRQRVEREAGLVQLVEQRAVFRWTARCAAKPSTVPESSSGPAAAAAAAAGSPRPGPPHPSAPRRPWSATVDVDLDADLQRRQFRWPLLRQPLRDLDPVDGVDQSKWAATSRVLLLCTGPMQCHCSGSSRSSAIFSTLPDVVLAEGALARVVRLAHGFGAEVLETASSVTSVTGRCACAQAAAIRS